jgi:hypothetical protein
LRNLRPGDLAWRGCRDRQQGRGNRRHQMRPGGS